MSDREGAPGDTGRATTRGRERRDRHRAPGDDRHAGAADGQAAARPVLRLRDRRPRSGRLLLPADRRRRHEHRAGLLDGLVGHRLRRLRVPPRHVHPAPGAMARTNRAGRRRHRVAGRHAGPSLAPTDPAAAARTAGGAWMDGQRRLGARVHPLPRQLRRGPREALPRPAAGQPVQRRLLDPGDDDGGGRAPTDPAGNGRRGHPGRRLQGRVQLRPARGQFPLRRRPDDGRQPLDLQERRQGDRLAARRRPDVHGQVQRARGQLVPYPLQLLGRRRQPVPRRRPRLLANLRGASWPANWRPPAS